ncbi:hypothetical protein [Gracilibacillus saliphilus]|uniref:hypothetical protein n=1 Tax=Gracilibacillus saliphilus TaxID=543890 RepID=UPI0013D80173|nr:hypothetical protein [Gracilibacillus saliphilus]
MVQGRLQRESNPTPGTGYPGFLPQHETNTAGEFQTTGHRNPLPVANYVQNSSGVWIPKQVNDDGSANVQVTGSLIDKPLTRRVSTSGTATNIIIDQKIGVKGVFISLIVHGVTGTFSSGQGISLRVLTNAGTEYIGQNGRLRLTDDSFTKINSAGQQIAVFYPDLSIDPTDFYANGGYIDHKVYPFFLGGVLRVSTGITGTFGSGEGIDYEVVIQYLY